MKTNTLFGLIAIGLVATAVSAATGAYFSDTETSTDNTMEAGVLNLAYNNCDGDQCGDAVFTIIDLKPSYTRYSDDIVLRINDNYGKIYKKIIVDKGMCFTNVITEPELVYENDCPRNDLYSEMWFDLARVYSTGTVETIIPDETVSIVNITGKWIYLGIFPPFEDITIRQSFHLWDTVDNWAQGDTCLVTEEFMLYQDNAPHPANCWDPYTEDHVCVN